MTKTALKRPHIRRPLKNFNGTLAALSRPEEKEEALSRVSVVAGELLGNVMALGVGLDSILAAAKGPDSPAVEVDPMELAMLEKAAGQKDPLEGRVRIFLLQRFTVLRDNLAEQLHADEIRDTDTASKELATFDILIACLSGREKFSENDEALLHEVVEIAKRSDEATNYREVAFEHWAYVSLIQRLSGIHGVPGKPTG